MAEKELRRLKRRELLQMLLIQCEETERLQQESDEIKEQFAVMAESYQRLKKKLDVKDERLNQKDASIAQLKAEIEELKKKQETRLGEAGSLAEATDRISEIFGEAQKAAERYLMSIQKNGMAVSEKKQSAAEGKEKKQQPPLELGRITSIRKRQNVSQTRQTGRADRHTETAVTEYASLVMASGDIYG